MTLRGILDRLQRSAIVESPPLHPNGGGLAFGDLYPRRSPPGLTPAVFSQPGPIASSTSSTVLALANPARRGLTIVNDGSANLYVALGPGASTLAYTVKLVAGSTWNLGAVDDRDLYRGIVSGVWDAASGSARVTET